MRIAIAGSSGFIGSYLVPFLKQKGHELILLSRKGGAYYWNPQKEQIDPSILENLDAVINLCGESVTGRWSRKKMAAIMESRHIPTRFLCKTLLNLKHPPKLYMGASAIGYYGDRGNEVLTEESRSGHGYLAEVCREWESIPQILKTKEIRTIFLRFGIVLGRGGGMLKKVKKPFQMGFGAILGSGKQKMSWVAMDDVLQTIVFLMQHTELFGPFNIVAPHAVSNFEFSKVLGELFKRPILLFVPKCILTLFLGAGADILLSSTQAHPELLLKNGYQFVYPEIKPALKKYLQINT